MEANTQNYTEPKTEDFKTKASTLPQLARALIVKDQAAFERGGELLKTIKKMRGEISETFDPIIKKAHETHKEAIERKKNIEAPLVEAEGIIKPALATYHEEQEKIRIENQRKAEEEATKQSEEAQLNAAVAAEKDGYHEEAEAILNTPVTIVRPIVPQTKVAVAGISFRGTYSAEVVDIRALLRAIVANIVPIQAIEANTTFLNQQARSMQTALNYPGVRVVKSTNVAGGKK